MRSGSAASGSKMVNLSAAMAPTFVERVNQIVETVRALGPSPLNSSKQTESVGVS